MDATSDAELMARTRQGDAGAFASLVDRYKDPLVNSLTRLAGSKDRAEDLAQETFLRLYQNAARYSEQGKLLPFLFQIAINLLRTEERRRRRWRVLLPFVSHDPTGFDSQRQERDLLRSEVQTQVSAAIAQLPLSYREPLVLHEIEGLPYDQIAMICGIPEGTVKSRISRGRERLRSHLAPYWNGVTSCTTTAS
jgi:RNA polymerase sigma-70 factor (ECF subfamily)